MLFNEYSELYNREVRSFFAGANGAGGFRGYYDSVFDTEKFSKIFILKGGPGTGKSSLMRAVAVEFEGEVEFIEYIYCASDADSLDGIILHTKKKKLIAVIDGTSPHMRDPELPGACEEIINLGKYWDSHALEKCRSEIEESAAAKSDGFIRAYKYLTAADGINAEIKRMTSKLVDYDKMKAACGRIMKQIGNGSANNIEFRLIEAVTMNGSVKFNSFERLAEKQYKIIESSNCSYIIFNELLKLSCEHNHEVYVSHSPLSSKQINGLYLVDSGVSFTLIDEKNENIDNTKYINTDRFIDAEQLAKIRQRYRFAVKCRTAMLSGAVESLEYASNYHFELENIYKSAMDFNMVDKEIKTLTKSIKEYIR